MSRGLRANRKKHFKDAWLQDGLSAEDFKRKQASIAVNKILRKNRGQQPLVLGRAIRRCRTNKRNNASRHSL